MGVGIRSGKLGGPVIVTLSEDIDMSVHQGAELVSTLIGPG
jgi:hypothetical protein